MILNGLPSGRLFHAGGSSENDATELARQGARSDQSFDDA